MTFRLADRFEELPVHAFAEVDRLKREAIAQGKDVIDLGVGDPDIPTPQPIIDACTQALQKPANHRYPYQSGSMRFRESVAAFMKRRYDVTVDPQRNIVPLIGSKEGIAHFPIAFVNPGEIVIAPDPGYPAYVTGTKLAGGVLHSIPLLAKNRFLMPLNEIPADVVKRARLMFFNYPNNPTTGWADRSDFESIAQFCKTNDIIAAHDAAYQELFFEEAPPSLMQTTCGLDGGIEFHSLSKTFNMTGWRVGFAVGEPSLIAGLSRLKANIDTGLFLALQEAAAFALDHCEEFTKPMIELYRRRKDTVVQGLNAAGFKSHHGKATIYVWTEVPGGSDSMTFTKQLLDKTGVVVTPGSALGQSSGSYFRIALTQSEERLSEAVRRMAAFAKA